MGPETLLAYAARWPGAQRKGERVRWRAGDREWALRLGTVDQMTTLMLEIRATYVGRVRVEVERELDLFGLLTALRWRAPLPAGLEEFRARGDTTLLAARPAVVDRIASSILWLDLRGRGGELRLRVMLSELLGSEDALKGFLDEMDRFFQSVRAAAPFPR